MLSFIFIVLLFGFVNTDNVITSGNSTSISNNSLKTANGSVPLPTNPVNVTTDSHKSREGVTNPPIFTEGGVDHLSKIQNYTVNSQSLPSEMAEIPDHLQPVQSKEVAKSSVHPRKGVNMDLIKDESINNTLPVASINSTQSSMSSAQSSNSSANTNKGVQIDTTNSVSNMLSTNVTNTTEKLVPKKPTLTIDSLEAFPGVDFASDSKQLLSYNSSKTGSTILDAKVAEISKSADGSFENASPQHKQGKDIASQPGFILPLVITILAVPMLALVGYQAVRRGREAWKNRHYRRMDFLIDGMYND